MSVPKRIKSYDAEWMTIAMTLAERGEVVVPTGDAKRAKALRLMFYGFRDALANHDAANPWLGAVMETQATITAEGHLRLQRNVLSTLLRGVLEHTRITPPDPSQETQRPQEPSMPASEQALLDYLSKKD